MNDDFLRPEAKAWLRRWGETLAAGGVAALGLWWSVTGSDLLIWAGGGLLILGGAAAFAAVQRARFRAPGGGRGVLQLDEGRLTYFGPLSGGSMAVRDIVSVRLDPRHRPAHWAFFDGESDLMVPVDAEGAEALYDVFAQLPGLDPMDAQAAIDRLGDVPLVVWQRERVPPSRQLR